MNSDNLKESFGVLIASSFVNRRFKETNYCSIASH